MVKTILSLFAVEILFSCSVNKIGAKEDIERKDSFSYDWAMNKTSFNGIRLYPLKDTITSIIESQNKGVYLELERGDTLVLISNIDKLFNNSISSFKDKSAIRHFYKNYNIDFYDDLPISAFITNKYDSFVYRLGIKKNYVLEYGIIKSNLPVLNSFKVGIDIKTLFRRYGFLVPQKMNRFKYVAIISTDVIGRAWYTKYNIQINNNTSSFTVIFIELSNNIIKNIIFTNNGTDSIIEKDILNL